MSNHSPITPPDELFNQWFDNWRKNKDLQIIGCDFYIATQAAQWGADQELEATLGLMTTLNIRGVDYVRNARRPKPPSLKEQGLEALERMDQFPTIEDKIAIRAALEALPNDH